MFAVIYSAKIKFGYEQTYQILWPQIAQYFIDHAGALGSCLHKTQDNIWLAYARWPDKATREAIWPDNTGRLLPEHIKKLLLKLQDCIVETYPEICLDVIDDLLLTK